MKRIIYLLSIITTVIQLSQSQTWHALGEGLNGEVTVIVIHNHEVYAGGYFTNAGNDPNADYIAKWNGNEWQHVAPSLSGPVHAIAFSGDDIYIGGAFSHIEGEVNKGYIARWDGMTWHALGLGLNKTVQAIAVHGTKVYVGGWFTNAAGIDSADHIALWENNSWHALGKGITAFNIGVFSIAINGDDVYAGGDYLNAGEVENTFHIARWDGIEWHPLGKGFWGDMGAVTIAVNGNDIYVGGDGGSRDTASCGIARWDGNIWHPVGEGLSNCLYGEGAWSIASEGNNTYVGGVFYNAGDVPGTEHLAKWDGENWSSLGTTGLIWNGFNPLSINSIAIDEDDVYVGGRFLEIGGVDSTIGIARWNETSTSVQHEKTSHGSFDIEIFPNPSKDIVQYKVGNSDLGLHTVSIINVTGETVFFEKTESQELNIASLPAGIYYVYVASEEIVYVDKIIKL